MNLFIPAGFLVISSLIVMSSISSSIFFLQFLWVLLGVLIVLFFLFVEWRSLFNYRWFIPGLYAVVIILLALVYFRGPLINQARSWIVLGPLTLQPVELAKISLILIYAQYFSRRHLSIARWRNIFISFVYFIVPVGLVALQPDLGSALILFGIWFGFLLVSGLPLKRVTVTILIFLIAGFLMWSFVLQNYQRQRIVGLFYPEENILTINYSVYQSKIAVGSAGWLGKGYGQGTQTQLGFLTEPETDFVLAALIEEWGWLAGLLVVGAFLALIFRILRIASFADRNFDKFICLGAAISLSWQFFLNIGSTLGLSPVIGVPLPFLSYGGSSLLTSFFLLAIINSIARLSWGQQKSF